MSIQPPPLDWVAIADQDLGYAMLAVRHRRYPGLACYHAQQAAEKYIKAALTAAGLTFPRSHDLPGLYAVCLANGVALVLQHADLTLLNPFATDVRYPGLMPTPTLAQARSAILAAGRVRRACRRLLGLP
jgi:HEPN domain-containing protein